MSNQDQQGKPRNSLTDKANRMNQLLRILNAKQKMQEELERRNSKDKKTQ
ncbi:hypothetical protein [Flavobacterium frigoris]|uniref:Uncharacterized protein n=1 Tax=Flavobacterium frigoris (strain PS1) TaxID=1086011 RepID=H7FPA0_FLAFP|nr:hypothetical protein [Flavobacterium frigoris]EIA09580.1 hypothetical protein HJ01_00998 [Flavobacterium frigoris PS1]